MHSSRAVRFAVPSLAVGLVLAPARPSFAVMNGAEDPGPASSYPQVVFMAYSAGSSAGQCSGTLITPRWILAARHCFVDSANASILRTASIPVSFGFDPVTPVATHFHTAAFNGPVAVMSDTDLDVTDDDSVALDLAVFRLDSPVPRSVAVPRHPPMVAGACGDDFDGTIVGFGRANDDEWLVCSEVLPVRRYNALSWTRSEEDDGDIFTHEWLITPQTQPLVCEIYDGPVQGDSGGPMIHSGGTLCGVISAGQTWSQVLRRPGP